MIDQNIPIEKQPPSGAVNGFRVLSEVIGKEEVQKAQQTLQRYKEGKANLENRIVQNEQWYKLRHWESMRKDEKAQVEPSSGWLFNAIANKHADAMDNFPSPNVLPREQRDEADAEALSSILLVAMVPTLAIAACFSRALYKRTGNIWTAAFFNGILMTVMTLANTCVYGQM